MPRWCGAGCGRNCPSARGILILDETSFPKSGPHSVGAARQYCGALGKVANCQVAVTAALWMGQRAWPVGALLYLPETWTSDAARRAAARIPVPVVFQEKWRLALTLVRRARAAGLTLTAVVADAEYGDNRTVRQTLHRLRLPYALGISPTLTVFRGTPTLRVDRAQPPPRNRRDGWPDQEPVSVRALSDGVAGARVAPRDVAQRDPSPVGSRLRRAARHAGDRLAPAGGSPQRFGSCANGASVRPGAASTISSRCPRRPRWPAARPLGASALGDRTALPRFQIRTRARSLRGSDVSRVAAPHGDQRRGLRVSPERTPPTPRRPTADVSSSLRVRPRDLHGPVPDQSASIPALDESGGTTVSSTSDLTKSDQWSVSSKTALAGRGTQSPRRSQSMDFIRILAFFANFAFIVDWLVIGFLVLDCQNRPTQLPNYPITRLPDYSIYPITRLSLEPPWTT